MVLFLLQDSKLFQVIFPPSLQRYICRWATMSVAHLWLFTLFLPPQPILVQNGGVRLGHDRVARELLTRATAGDTLLQNAVAGVAVPFGMFVHTAFTTALYVGRTTAAVKAAFAQ